MSDLFENSDGRVHDIANLREDKMMPIAIIGMSFRGPGDATNIENLWKMVSEARESRSPIPQERWNNTAFYHPDHKHHGTHNVKAGHFFKEDLARFDAPFFSMTSTEAAALDPSQRLLLECTYEALENGGIPMERIMGTKTSVFVGSFATDYTDLLLRDPEALPMHQCTNSSQSRAMISNRLSYFFDLHGPCVTVDTACSGSLVALHLGCRSLQTGDAKCSVVAGVNVILSHEFMITMSMMKFLSPDGRCYTFDDRGNGYARGEGVGCVILKPLADALKDGDTIRAIIRGTGSNQDGKTSGITLPNPVAQEVLIRDVYEAAGLDPKDTTYVEAHGTGTAAGDPIETKALSHVFCRDRSSDDPLLIGSIKSNVGHLEGASGIVAVIKTVLMLENEIILPNKNFENPNPRIPFRNWKLKIPLSVQPWPAKRPHRASINSFGYGGSNAHAIIEGAQSYLDNRGVTGPQKGWKSLRFSSGSLLYHLGEIISYPPAEKEAARDPNTQHTNENVGSLVNRSGYHQIRPISSDIQRTRLLVLSAFDEATGSRQVESLIRYLGDRSMLQDPRFLDDLAYTLNERRTKFIWKTAIQAKSIVELKKALGKSPRYIRSFKIPKIGFIFTGQGAQWCGMGRELLAQYPAFQSTIKRIDTCLQSLGAPFNVEEEINTDPNISKMHTAFYSQTMCTAIQIGLVDLLAFWGIIPASVTGHSSGEIAAAYTIGALSLEDAMAIAYYRGVASRRMQEISTVKGTMMAVGMSSRDVEPIINSLTTARRVEIACVNSPNSITVSGDESAIEELETIMDERKIFSRRLAVDVAYHSHHMSLVADTYANAISGIRTRDTGNIEFFSSVTGKRAAAADLGPSYWVSNLLSQVKFADSARLLCLQTGVEREIRRQGQSRKVNILVEIGPHSALAGPIKQIIQAESKLKDSDICYISALIRKQDAVTTVLDLAGKLATRNYPINFSTLNRPVGDEITSVLVDLPPYPWNHSNTYWAEPRISKNLRTRQFPRTDLLGALDSRSNPWEPRWHNYIRVSETPWLLDHKIQSNTVYPAAGFIVMAIEAVYQFRKKNSSKPIGGFRLKDVNIGSALLVPDESEAIETLLTLKRHFDYSRNSDAHWDEFCVYSVTKDNTWTEHCRGLITVQRKEAGCVDVKNLSTERGYLRDIYANIERDCVREFNMEEFYKYLASIGLEYGKTFAGVLRAKSGCDHAAGTISIPNTATVMPLGYQYPFIIHPATLDSAFHLVFLAMSGKDGFLQDPAIPVFAEEIYVSCDIPAEPGQELNVCTLLSERSPRSLRSSIWATNPSNSEAEPLVIFTDLHWKVLVTKLKEENPVIDEKVTYSFQWKEDVDLMAPGDLSFIYTGLVPREMSSMFKALDPAAVNLFKRASGLISDSDVSQIANHHKSLWKHMQHLTDLIGLPSEHKMKDTILCDDTCLAKEQLLEKPHGIDSERILLHRIGNSLPEILQRKIDPSILIERKILHKYFRESWSANCIQDSAAYYLSLLCHKYPDISILEIEGKLGSVVRKAVPAMMGPEGSNVPNFVQYVLTSIQPSRIEVLNAENESLVNLISIKELNIEDDPVRQGFKNASFDVIIAPAQIAANDLSSAVLGNIKKLLRNNGRLIILGTACIQPSLLLMLGVFPEWWEARGDYLYTGSDEELNECLGQAGFSDTEKFSIDIHSAPWHETSIIVARTSSTVSIKLTDIVLIIGGDNERLQIDVTHLLNLFARIDIRAKVATLEDAEIANEICVAICDLEGKVMNNPSEIVFEKIKNIFLRSKGTLWVTRGGRLSSQNPRANIITGFSRTARAENDGSKIITLDLDVESQLSPITTAEVICSLFEHVFINTSSIDNLDLEYVERRGKLMIPRIVENYPLSNKILMIRNPIPERQPFQQPGRPLVLDLEHSLTDMKFVEDKRLSGELGKDSIEIEIRAVGFMAKDTMVASTQAILTPVSIECSGIVTKVGKDVHWFVPGDRAAGFGNGAVCNLYRDRATSFQKLPDDMSFEVAASLPVAYVTAYHTVHNIAHVTLQDRVLVHSADTTLGHALLEICLSLSSRIFASVSTWEEKRLLVTKYGLPERHILYKEDPNLKSSAMQVTLHEGFDIIFSTTHGYSSQLAWDCISHYGRFISLDSRDSDLSGRLDMSNFKKSAGFSGFDILHFINNKRGVVNEIWATVMHLFRQKLLVAIQKITTFPIENIEDALRAVKESNLTKIVLVAGPESTVKALPIGITRSFLRADASYLLVGGLGGIGRAMAIWMIDHGARNIIFANRSGMLRPEARITVELLREKGASVAVYSCDVSNSKQLAELVEETSQFMPPIRGVIQGAMVLRDMLLEQMTLADYKAVTYPKIQGTWNLHNNLPKELDFFIMLSSISGIIGNASQAAYAAGNAFMDAFAAYRNFLGLPAVTLDLGVITGVGYLASSENKDLLEAMERQGFESMDEERLMALIQSILVESHNSRATFQTITGLGKWRKSNSLPAFDSTIFSRFRRLSLEAEASSSEGEAADPFQVSLSSARTIEEASELVCAALITKLASRNGILPENIDSSKAISDYGVDSLVAVELRNWITREMDSTVPILELLANSPMTSLSMKIASRSRLVHLGVEKETFAGFSQ